MRKPIRPRAGTRYSIRTQPVPWLTICSMRPLRSASSCVIDADVVLGHVDREPLDRLVHARRRSRASRPAAGRRSARSPRGASAPPAPRAAARRGPAPPRRPVVRCRARGSRRCRPAPGRAALATCRAVSFVPSCPASGEVLMPIDDRQRRLVDGDHRQRPRILGIGERLADRDVRQPGDGDDLARPGLLGRRPGRAPRSRTARSTVAALDACRRRGTRRSAGRRGSSRCARGTARGGRHRATRRGS